MNELTPTTPHKPITSQNSEAASLRDMVNFANSIAGVEAPPEEKTFPPAGPTIPPEAAAAIEKAFAEKRIAAIDPALPGSERTVTRLPNRIFLTGKLGVGKDYVAEKLGYGIIGFADPLYELANLFFAAGVTSTANKDLPGMREFLQAVGQWGRGTVNNQYPFSPTRAMFVTMIRSMASALPLGVKWDEFGKGSDLWVNSLIIRAAGVEGPLAATNVRFENEFKLLQSEGWQHWHVMASPAAWMERLTKKSLTPSSHAVKDTSEQLAAHLDGNVTRQISQKRAGSKLRVIWNDLSPSPSPRFYTLAELV